jgi:hypothetical protein
MPGTVKSEALPLYPCVKLKKERVKMTFKLVLDKGHFITGLKLM